MAVFALIYPTLLKINLFVIWQVDLVQNMKLTKRLCLLLSAIPLYKVNLCRQNIVNTQTRVKLEKNII